MNMFEEKNFEVGYWTNNSPVNPGSFSEQMNEGYIFEEKNFKLVTGPIIHLHLG